ncbi:radical SAM protein [Streptococcus intermedius]|uniref:radical SAM protein n=2 Tax=Streptococcus intermedius TaxID=1338 RepID=UPI000BBA6F56|nr:radical SAM protein [Streptococcus intermedius]
MDERLLLTNWNSLYIQNDISFTDAIKPVYVGFKITENCNQRCSHCWAGKNLTINHSFDEIIAALNKIKILNPLHITITGGEPLVHEHWLDILGYAKKNFPIVELFTNAVLFSEKSIKKLSSLFGDLDFIQVSLDGLRTTYKKQRGSDDFQKVIENIKLIVKYNLNIRVNMTITHLNIEEMIDVYELVDSIGITSFSISPVYPLRRGKKLVSLVDYTQYLHKGKLIEKMHAKRKSQMNLTVIYPMEVLSEKATYTQESTYFQRFNTDLLHWTIDGRGDIFHFMDQFIYKELKVGNIYENTIEELEANDYTIQKNVLEHSNQGLKCMNCSLVESCPGFAYAKSYPEIAFSYKRCVFNEKQ